MRAACLLFALAASGCIDATNRDRLMFAVREYNDGVRWARYDDAVSHLPFDERQRFSERHARLDGELEIADYEVQRIDLDGPDRAAVRVDVTWTIKRRGIVERTLVEQKWEKRKGDWLVVRETRLSGSPLTLFEERPAAKKPAQEADAPPAGE